jgi:hypothetical protein
VYHIRGWGKFNRHYGDFCTGADILEEYAPMWYSEKLHDRASAAVHTLQETEDAQ